MVYRNETQLKIISLGCVSSEGRAAEERGRDGRGGKDAENVGRRKKAEMGWEEGIEKEEREVKQ